MKRFSDTCEPVVRIPVIVEPVQVQVPLAVVVPEIRDVLVVQVPPDRTNCAKYLLNHHPLNSLGIESYLGSLILRYLVRNSFIFRY